MTDTPGIRLNKFLADCGLASRRKADTLIFEGQVQVNGVVCVNPGTRVRPDQDEIRCQRRVVAKEATQLQYVMLHKPIHTVSTVQDPQNRPTVLDLLSPELRATRVYPVGRLDYMSEGLLLLTNDGYFAERLTHPRYAHPKFYEVHIRENIHPEQLTRMRQGMCLAEGEKLAPIQVRCSPVPPRGNLLQMTLYQGINRQIRRICRDLQLTILRLTRVGIGTLQLGNLPVNRWRALSTQEVQALMRDAQQKAPRKKN